MPIRPENRARYPANWRDIRERIRRRAKDCCEQCKVPNGATIYRDDTGAWHFASLETASEGHKLVKIVCTTAHLDHTPENNDDANLRFLCQRCHLRYDAEHHAQTAASTRREGKALGDLFE
jgi:5-methylcytosine-specific restriction endonuclease McrA